MASDGKAGERRKFVVVSPKKVALVPEPTVNKESTTHLRPGETFDVVEDHTDPTSRRRFYCLADGRGWVAECSRKEPDRIVVAEVSSPTAKKAIAATKKTVAAADAGNIDKSEAQTKKRNKEADGEQKESKKAKKDAKQEGKKEKKATPKASEEGAAAAAASKPEEPQQAQAGTSQRGKPPKQATSAEAPTGERNKRKAQPPKASDKRMKQDAGESEMADDFWGEEATTTAAAKEALVPAKQDHVPARGAQVPAKEVQVPAKEEKTKDECTTDEEDKGKAEVKAEDAKEDVKQEPAAKEEPKIAEEFETHLYALKPNETQHLSDSAGLVLRASGAELSIKGDKVTIKGADRDAGERGRKLVKLIREAFALERVALDVEKTDPDYVVLQIPGNYRKTLEPLVSPLATECGLVFCWAVSQEEQHDDAVANKLLLFGPATSRSEARQRLNQLLEKSYRYKHGETIEVRNLDKWYEGEFVKYVVGRRDEVKVMVDGNEQRVGVGDVRMPQDRPNPLALVDCAAAAAAASQDAAPKRPKLQWSGWNIGGNVAVGTVEGKDLFVRGLSAASTDQSLLNYFKKHGAIKCKVLRDRDTGESKKAAFVTFYNAEQLTKVMAGAHRVDGAQVSFSLPKGKGDAPKGDAKGIGKGAGKGAEKHDVFAGGLDAATTDASLLAHFSSYGATSARVVIDKETGKSRGFGFVTFTSPAQVQAAVAATHQVDGKEIMCRASGGRDSDKGKGKGKESFGKGQQDTSQTFSVFVAKLSKHTDDSSLLQYFQQYGATTAKVKMDDWGSSKGFGFVDFPTEAARDKALQDTHVIDGWTVKVEAKGEAKGDGKKGGGKGGGWWEQDSGYGYSSASGGGWGGGGWSGNWNQWGSNSLEATSQQEANGQEAQPMYQHPGGSADQYDAQQYEQQQAAQYAHEQGMQYGDPSQFQAAQYAHEQGMQYGDPSQFQAAQYAHEQGMQYGDPRQFQAAQYAHEQGMQYGDPRQFQDAQHAHMQPELLEPMQVEIPDGVRIPTKVSEWAEVQHLWFPDSDPLPPGWLRAVSKTTKTLYFVRVADQKTTYNIYEVMQLAGLM